MNIAFFSFADIEAVDGRLTSDVASARYRVIQPALQLMRQGHSVKLRKQPVQPEQDGIDVAVISKSFDGRNESGVAALKARGVRVVFDVSDNHFVHPQLGPHYQALAEMADAIVVPTTAMAQAVRQHCRREAVVISDPVEGDRAEPCFRPSFPQLELLWFGHPTNLDSLDASLNDLRQLAQRLPLRLTIVTSPTGELSKAIGQLNSQPGNFRCRLLPWSTESMAEHLAAADLVVLPTLDDPAKAVKSPNRLIEALWAGRAVVTQPQPAHQEFAEFVFIAPTLSAGIEQALAAREQVESRILAGQRHIARHYSPYRIGRDWLSLLAPAQTRPLRLNLGCGDKILPGYVNVDVVASRAGQRPDLLCDLHSLHPFDDDSVDEILSVHVVEHFWRWEVLDILKEWVRVLKPGAPLILECPNLIAACQRLLEDPVERSATDRRGQETMWVFYGDPNWQDPYMVHRWAYTPASLAALMQEAGLSNISQQPAQFKLREPRDMRVVGYKPANQ
ncbi:methyltransferase domain-containing protein [Chitinimonas lacunae]|uniref:Methyltransferase domain-containing protein n=1 Tax=Chitinimonas lacunae TaxID=1963018 RepID=A0ABV8MWN8_9NEIS